MSLNLLSFVWKRQLSLGQDSSDSLMVPALVTASTSETYETSSHEDVVSRETIQVPVQHAPQTPEGLKPRESIQRLQRRLSLPDEYMTGMKMKAATTNERSSRAATASAPLQRPCSSSWSIQNSISSPPISTSSFYASSWSAHEDVATSPLLVPGRARTAVGALVAQQQQQPRTLDYSKPFNPTTDRPRGNPSRATSMSILPPSTFQPYDTSAFDHLHEDDYFRAPYVPPLNVTASSQAYKHRSLQPPPPLMPYHPLESPPRNNNTNGVNDQDSVMRPSPSSLAAAKHRQGRQHQRFTAAATPGGLLDTSFSSRAKLLDPRGSSSNGADIYDIAPILDAEPLPPTGTEVVLRRHHHGDYLLAYKNSHDDDDDLRDMSAMSYSAAAHFDQDETVWSRTISRDDDEDDDDDDESVDGKSCKLDRAHGANVKERRKQEDLFSHVLERLQNDVELVAQVEAIGESAAYGSWITKTPLEESGLITGFDKDARSNIVRRINQLLHRVDAVPLDNDSEHADASAAVSRELLRDSLLYCRQLVYMSVAEKATKTYQVKDGIRAAMGIIPPDSPEMVRRGGDSSVFSLPPDDQTPMASNVSLTTTITTHHSPPRYVSTPGLQLRRTMETILALLQVLTRACVRLDDEGLSAEQDDAAVTDEIKCAYQQIVSLDHHDLQSLVDIFEPCQLMGRGVIPFRPMHLPFQAQHRVALGATTMTPPRSANNWNAENMNGIEEEEGLEMELEHRNPFSEIRLEAAADEVRDDRLGCNKVQEDPLNFLAGVCTRISETAYLPSTK